jgi:alginate O-acetyltransferase complex protein AlgI
VIAEISDIPAWAQMWTITGIVWLAFKLYMWRQTAPITTTGNRLAPALGFFLGWPGMDVAPFFRRCVRGAAIHLKGWSGATIRVASGLALIWFVAPALNHRSAFLAGWVGMIGTVLLAHFGVFHLLALSWRALGVPVTPIMIQPTRATSVADFWGLWNHGFRDITFHMIFRPMLRRLGVAGATMAAFGFSGVVHDLIISCTARGGYGLPTLYFVIQGLAILFEKSAVGRRMGPILRRMYTYVIVIAPLGLAFHRPFVINVFVPFLRAIGAL